MDALLASLAQYGPTAIFCGVMLVINYKHQDQMARRLARQEGSMRQLVRGNTAALHALAAAIGGMTGRRDLHREVEDAVHAASDCEEEESHVGRLHR